MENIRQKHYRLSIIHYPLQLCLVFSLLLLAACSQLEKPKTEPFYSQTAPPQKKEFRWSNGKMPKSFDPARAAAPPETDLVRAVYEGLTDTNPKTLETIPALAEKWSASEDFKTWTFHLRKDAKWSNGERVTALDFVRSWKRLAAMGEKVSHRELLENIVGMKIAGSETPNSVIEEDDVLSKPLVNQSFSFLKKQPETAPTLKIDPKPPTPSEKPVLPAEKEEKTKTKPEPEVKFGVEATDNFTLKVSLASADKDFPALVAHPIFRPIYGDGKDFEGDKLNAGIVTSGAFRISSVGADGITLDRSEYFWGKDKIELERVRFVPKENAEKALEAYRNGEIDAVTNADFEPLALKLLTPFHDFQRTTHSALNFYEFNRAKVPFDDRRVREALAISIERERLTEGEMEGSTKPALSFLPFDKEKVKQIVQDKEKAKNLLTEAGFPNGENFPIVRLIVNRNDVQQRIARSVAKMWEQNLNIKTEIIVKEAVELETVRNAGDFDVLRRGVVLPTADEKVGMMAIFAPKSAPKNAENKNSTIEPLPTEKSIDGTSNNSTDPKKSSEPVPEAETSEKSDPSAAQEFFEGEQILTEEDAIAEIPAIPLYFPTSYSLVKPYIQGFEINTLDAPSLKDVKIDNNWQPKKPGGES